MSGGSFDYLYVNANDVEGLAKRQRHIEAMRDQLVELGFDDVAAKTQDVLDRFREIEQNAGELASVWHAVEWYVSCDWGLKDVESAVEQHRFLHPLRP